MTAKLSPEDRATFLNAIREGQERPDAARLIGRTGRQLRAICNPNSPYYDRQFEQDYLAAVAAAPPRKPRVREQPRADTPTVNANGTKRHQHLTDSELDEFLERVAGGEPRDQAARAIGTSMLQIRRKETNDPDFAQRLAEAYETGYPHYQEWLRSKVVDFINDGNYNALRDQILIHLPEADKLRTSKHEHEVSGKVAIHQIKAVLHGLPSELLSQVIEHVEAGEEQKAIEMLTGDTK